jgi:hypothetical protein
LLGAVDLVLPGDVLQGARLLAIFFFSANLMLLGLAVSLCTKRSLVATVCMILFFLSSSPTMSVHSMAWTEAPFITFSMATFLLFCRYVSRPSIYLLLLASLTAGCAVSTRYVGVVLFPTIVLAFLLMDHRPLRQRLRDIFIFSSISCLPLIFWLIRNILLAQSATNRQLVFDPVGLSHAKKMFYALGNFILPIPISNLMKALFVAGTIILLFRVVPIIYRKTTCKQHAASTEVLLPVLCIMYAVIYVVFLFISISFFDAHTPLDSRILLPASLPVIVACIVLAWLMSQQLNRRWIWSTFVLFVFFIVSINMTPAIATAVKIHENGQGYNSRYWNNSDIIAALVENPSEVPIIYSNGPDVIRFWTGKEAMMIPAKKFAGVDRVNSDYQKQLTQMLQECKQGKALIVYLNAITWRWYLPSIEEIETTEILPVLKKGQGGVIYGTR